MGTYGDPFGEPRKASKLRAGDEDRDKTISFLNDRYISGHLDTDELRDRQRKAMECKFKSELYELTTDLPGTEFKEAKKPRPHRLAQLWSWWHDRDNVPRPVRWSVNTVFGLLMAILPSAMTYSGNGWSSEPGWLAAADITTIVVGGVITVVSFCGMFFTAIEDFG